MIEPIIVWNAPEHYYTEKDADWYWAVGIVTLTIVVLAIILNQIIFAVLTLLGVLALTLHASRRPRILQFEINDRGIIIDDILYPFLHIESFWIPHDHARPKIILKSHKALMPLIHVPIDEVNPEDVREVLLKYIAETEHDEPLSHLILERLGF